MKTVEFKFGIGEEVRIEAIDRPGLIDALLCVSAGPQYRVIYWNEGRRYCEWMNAWELAEK